jgi:hypothetical protein
LQRDSFFQQNNSKVYFNDLNVQTIALDSTLLTNIGSKGQTAWTAIPSSFFEKLPAPHVFKKNKNIEVEGGKGFLDGEGKYILVEF